VGDFLHKGSETPLSEFFVAAGAACRLSTNFEPILEAARESFFPVYGSQSYSAFHLRFWVDVKAGSKPPWPKPYFRGLGHLIFAGFDAQNSMMIDLRARRAIGRFSPAMGADNVSWKTIIFPVLLSIMGASVGIVELHCACVVRDENGLLLAGGSGSGKSTLALALAQSGFAFLSDDRTYVSEHEGRMFAWGLPTLLKLRPDAMAWFPEMKDLTPPLARNAERAIQIDPSAQLGLPRARRCEPRGLIFLERLEYPAFDLGVMPRAEATALLEEDLIAEASDAVEKQVGMIGALVELPCWRLAHGGAPGPVAQELARRWRTGH
jgi:hypothetical protein